MPDRPNILIIIADQLSQQALRVYGNTHGSTPNIDRIAERGVRFSQCYTPCPLCQPARASFWTGRFPHETGVLSNGRNFPVSPVPATMPALGELFTAAGYDARHFGKAHDSGGLRGFHVEPHGTVPLEATAPWPLNGDTFMDRHTTERVVEYLSGPLAEPFIAVADLNNPHNICGYVGAFAGPHANPPIPADLPPLPANFRVEDFEDLPKPVQYICCSHRRQAQTEGWSEENFRHYLAAYYHYLSRVDDEIGRILDALWATPQGEDTLVVFLADHGDGMAAHQLVTKQVSLYDETTRVPFFFAGPGVTGQHVQLDDPLVSLLDLVPTLCAYAEIPTPEGLWGRSLLPWLTGQTSGTPHDYVVSEWHTEWGHTIEPGRMVRTRQHKYMRYLEGDGEEFYDLAVDPGETRTLIRRQEHARALAEHRALLAEHMAATADPFLTYPFLADRRWRSHQPGYHHHRGPAAPMVE